jgi:hypothetical protein
MYKSILVIAGISIPGLMLATDKTSVTGAFVVEDDDLGLYAKGVISLSLPNEGSSPIGSAWGARPYTPGYGIPPQWACYTDLKFPMGERVWEVIFETARGSSRVISRSALSATFTFESATGRNVDARNPPPTCRPHEGSVMHSVLRINFEDEPRASDPSWGSDGSELAFGGLSTIIPAHNRRSALSYIPSNIEVPATVRYSAEAGYALQSIEVRQAFRIPEGESSSSVQNGISLIARESRARQQRIHTDVLIEVVE